LFPWREIGRLIIESFPLYIQQSERLLIVSVVLLLVFMQYRRMAGIEQRVFGVPLSDPLRNTLAALGAGFLGGLLATFLFVFLGISLMDAGIGYLWLLAIALMMVHPRFICFAYAGGILSVTHLLFGWPGLSVPAIMALVAVLHLVESLLILLHGPTGATPVYVRRPDGRVVGGFTMQKFWPMPFIALVAFMIGQDMLADLTLPMPGWWPLIKPQEPPPPGMTYVYVLFPVVAALGYGDIAITRDPRTKARRTAGLLFGYSVVLMALALAGSAGFGAAGGPGRATGFAGIPAAVWQWLAALFSPLGHELVIYLGRREEEKGRPFYDAARGAVVLGVIPGTPAAEMGLRRGDVIVSINGFPVRSRQELQDVLTPWAVDVRVVVSSLHTGEERTVHYPGKIPPFGVILAPEPTDPGFMALDDGGYGLVLRRFGRRLARLWAGRGSR